MFVTKKAETTYTISLNEKEASLLEHIIGHTPTRDIYEIVSHFGFSLVDVDKFGRELYTNLQDARQHD